MTLRRVGSNRIITYQGVLAAEPAIGQCLIMRRDADGRRIVTSPVVRVLGVATEPQLTVQTLNSVYQIHPM